MNISKVKSVQGDGHFDNEYGRLFSFEYVFDDEVVLKANHKSENSPFKPGDVVEYTVKGKNDYGSYGTVSKPKPEGSTNGNSGFKKSGSNPAFALAYAKDYAGFYIAKGSDYTPEETLETAAKFLEWLKSND